MAITRSSDVQGPCVTVLIGITVLKKSSLRAEKSFDIEAMARASSSSSPSLPLDAVRVEPYKSPHILVETPPMDVARRAYRLFHDPRLTCVEETRGFCAGCQLWIPFENSIYSTATWDIHVALCRPLLALKPEIIRNQPARNPIDNKLKKEAGAKWSRHRTEEERAKFLRNDPRAVEVEPRRVLCALCGGWIKLRNTTTYCPTPWLIHANRCETYQGRAKGLSPRLEQSIGQPLRTPNVPYPKPPRRSFSPESEDEVRQGICFAPVQTLGIIE
ncbi:hypothetical protein M422DRAFT_68395 [Sphaerobolus stellatus SS14]|uniref:Uncharacterized protein n=1 Tax=Sphaerobolus stellatus (strain SS14) TaxID=990650 RepID=A0A0C9VI45_SPHS4|nr:hypothetical protein M422DRAFT_68395 [Sphaerobolus stellatus SS14]